MNRTRLRTVTIQCLYQMEINEVTVEQAVQAVQADAQAENEVQLDVQDMEMVLHHAPLLVHAVWQHRLQLQQLLSLHLQHWQLERLSRIDRLVLLLALYELLHTNTPHKVAIHEAIVVAKYFGTERSGKFVNGVLRRVYTVLIEEGQLRQP